MESTLVIYKIVIHNTIIYIHPNINYKSIFLKLLLLVALTKYSVTILYKILRLVRPRFRSYP